MGDSGADRAPSIRADRISSLPDDLLLHVLLRLGYARDAARTSLLSRRWRHLRSLLPEVDVTLHDVPLRSLEDALHRAAHPCVRLLDVAVPRGQDYAGAATVSSVLRVAGRLSPSELRFALPRDLAMLPYVAVDLPCFNRATSIELYARRLPLTLSGGFPVLESLTLFGCHLHLATLIPRCPRLRVLTVTGDDEDITVRSASLQELVVESKVTSTGRIEVDAPSLTRLAMSLRSTGQLRVSVSAPMVEKVSWCCSRILGRWSLSKASVEMTATTEKPHGLVSHFMLPRPRVPICAKDSFSFENADIQFTAEVEKHMSSHFSVLELHLVTSGHVYGGFVSHLLAMHPATRCLKIVPLRSKVTEACPVNCSCDDEPINWRSEAILLISLEKVEIEDFRGEDHEFDFLKLIFTCAPLLTTVIVRPPDVDKLSDDALSEEARMFVQNLQFHSYNLLKFAYQKP